MKVLVVGGAGYLGGAVTDLLMQSSHEARVYDSLVYEDSYLKAVDFVFGDIRDREKLKRQLKWADCVVWLAALVGDGACALNPDISTELNHLALAWMAENFDGRIIFMSTCSVYGAQDGILDESSPINPLSIYAVTKFAAEAHLKDKNAIIFRLGTLFGLSDRFSRIRLDLVVNTMTAKAYAEGRLSVFGGAQYRPLLHVRDAARAIFDNIETEAKGIYNLHKINIKMSELAEEVKKQFPKIKIEKVEMKFEDARNYRVSSDKAKKIGFSPRLTPADGIKELKELLESGRIRDLN
ncbi:NAD(P)-dependent oxidoreductase, partial [Patescibacteria group bacterium]|nr:NAD(P)-dependent oxidoreductase [Patescibacteria group bacterium]